MKLRSLQSPYSCWYDVHMVKRTTCRAQRTRTLLSAARPSKLSNRGRRACKLLRQVTKKPMVTLTELWSCVELGQSFRRTITAALLRKPQEKHNKHSGRCVQFTHRLVCNLTCRNYCFLYAFLSYYSQLTNVITASDPLRNCFSLNASSRTPSVRVVPPICRLRARWTRRSLSSLRPRRCRAGCGRAVECSLGRPAALCLRGSWSLLPGPTSPLPEQKGKYFKTVFVSIIQWNVFHGFLCVIFSFSDLLLYRNDL